MLQKPRKTDLSEGGARNSALRALARREYSAAQLKAKLEQRGFSDDTADQALGQLAQAGWQSDARFAEMLVRNRIEQGYGPQRITHDLEQAGIPAAELKAAVLAAEADWNALCIALHEKKFGTAPEGAAQWQKHYRFLASRGFEPGHIRAALKKDHDD